MLGEERIVRGRTYACVKEGLNRSYFESSLDEMKILGVCNYGRVMRTSEGKWGMFIGLAKTPDEHGWTKVDA